MSFIGGAYLVLALGCVVLGLAFARWHAFTQGDRSQIAVGFLHVLGRASLVAGLGVVFWDHLVRLSTNDAWAEIAVNALPLVTTGGLLIYATLILVLRVVADAYGSSRVAAN